MVSGLLRDLALLGLWTMSAATETPPGLAARAAEAAAAAGLTGGRLLALRAEAGKRQRNREAADDYGPALLAYSRAVSMLSEHTETKAEAEASLDALVLAAGSGGLASRVVDLGALMREGIPEVEFMPGEFARRMVYAVGVTGFSGHPESGKTSTVSRLALDAMRAGTHVVYLDWEQGESETIRRLAAVGADAELLSERLTYIPFPGPPDWAELGTIWDEHPGAVGVFDSTRGILRTLGLDEDRASEVGQFMDPLVEFAVSRRVACLLIDHVAKAATGATGYARGSGDKLAAVQGQWYVNRVRPFSETEAGEIELVRWKARSGRLPRVHRFAVGDGQGKLTFRRLDADTTPQGRMNTAIIEYLRGRHPESASLRDIEAAIDGTATDKRDRVKALADADSRPVAAVNGRHTRYVYVPDDDREPTAQLTF